MVSDMKGPITENGGLSSSYPGGKGGAGVYQTIINLIPPHNTYIETHLGGGAIMRHKKPAKKNIGIDIDPAVIARWNDAPGITIIQDDAARYLADCQFTGHEFVYSDPPYLMETRTSGKLYNFEYSDDDHVRLLRLLLSLPCMVMVSGYHSALYNDVLWGWNKKSFESMTRGGTKRTEWVWYNYPDPVNLHDYSYLGDTFRERERIKRKLNRWVNRLNSLPVLERNALLSAMSKAIEDCNKNPCAVGSYDLDKLIKRLEPYAMGAFSGHVSEWPQLKPLLHEVQCFLETVQAVSNS